MEYRLLGPLEVRDGVRLLPLGGAKQRALLAMLVLSSNRVVPRERLIDGLWGEEPPETAVKTVQVYVSQLRKALGPALVTRPPGYLLAADPESIDLPRFERLRAEGRRALASGDPGRAARFLSEALGLWRGPALAEFGEPFATVEGGRLEDLRLATIEDRIDADLALDREAEVVGELRALIGEHPHRERLREQLMLALYRSGRQVEALAAYRDTRAVLDELGVEPGDELQRLEKAVLTHDPTLRPARDESPPHQTDLRAPLAPPVEREPAESRPPQRKVVTALFCDLIGSTSLGDAVDPEQLQALLARYFERIKTIVESHGGTVEKFIGDAVMAVFGVPKVHEDDALRAVRAAVEMREVLPELGVQARIGLETGEVVTGTVERLATGDVLNVAKRLEEAAPPGEVLVGARTFALVREAVDAERLEPLALRGKAEPVAAYRLLSVHELPERPIGSVMVGRERELEQLRAVLDAVVAESSCRLFTLVGEAGVGKSRLVREFSSRLEAAVAVGRCLPYGEGITYLPVIEVLKTLGVRPADSTAAAAIASLLGERDERVSAEQIAWAFRKTLEHVAAVRPLVVVFDDIQWGEETFLDLVEHVALLSRGAPILLLCMARPELKERRSGWPVALGLEPLSDDAVEQLIPASMGEDLRERIAHAAGGNPLFVEEMVAMADEEGHVVVPETLRALLVARLEQLDPAERGVLECAAVEGEIFHRGAVQALFRDAHPTPRLAALVRQQLISPYPSQLAGEDGFRFRHLLIRDAAYESMTKATRAEMHERLAEWLEPRGQDVVNLDVQLGYHLERAHHYQVELGRPDASLAERAGERLAAAGREALWRDDQRAAASLLHRAADLTRPLRLDVNLEIDLATVQSDPRTGAQMLQVVVERARSEHDETGEALALAAAAWRRATSAGDVPFEELEVLARRAASLLETNEDHAGLVHVWRAFGNVALWQGRHEETARAAEQEMHHARLAGEPAGRLFGLAAALTEGPRRADEALRVLEDALPRNPQPRQQLYRAWLLAMLGRFEDARAIALDADEQRREQTGDFGGDYVLAEIAGLEGDYEAAARYFRRQCELEEESGYVAVLATFAARLGRVLCLLGRHGEAEPLTCLGREEGRGQDVETQILWRQAQALVDSHRGDHRAAETLGREAVERSERTDALNWQGYALSDLAEVLATAGRADDAAAVLERALKRYGRKQNLAMVAQVRPRLDALRAEIATRL